MCFSAPRRPLPCSFDALRYMSDGRGIFIVDSLAADIGVIVGVALFAAWVTSTFHLARSVR